MPMSLAQSDSEVARKTQQKKALVFEVSSSYFLAVGQQLFRRCKMPRYLVFANQTAASPELTSAVREIVAQDADTEFVLLVPATPVEDLLDWQDGDSETIAQRTAQAAKDHLAGAGAKVARTEVGDASP